MRRRDIHLRFGSAQCAWSSTTRLSTARNGQRSFRLRRRSADQGVVASLVRQAERDGGRRSGVTTDERERLKALERENQELRRANEILRKASAFFAQAELDRRGKR